MDWQPIETAPKDGMVLVYCPDARQGKEIVAAQLKAGKPFLVSGIFAFDHAPATHWMPLPPPPKDQPHDQI